MLAAHRGAADAAGRDWKSAVYRQVQEEVKANRGLTIERMVELGLVSRSGFYRFDDAQPDPDRDMELRDAIQKIAVEWPSYGRPGVTKELRRRGWVVNPKRVRRLSRAAREKNRFVMDLQGLQTITLEDRHRFLELMKIEQAAYREYHAVQVRVQEFLRQNVG